MTTALLPHDPYLDTLCAARLLCDIRQRQPWTQIAQFCPALLCADCAQGEPGPEE